MGKENERPVLSRFSHTSNSCYLTAVFALCCVVYDSTHDVIERSHINKKWFYLFGATCLFSYLYVRPLIRRRLGSASRGYINYSTCYISWLVISVFYHLPSLESMGINIKADVSMWLACFLGSLCMLGTLHALYGMAVALRLLNPRLYAPMAGAREVWSVVLMNSVNLAVACSVHYSFCGNAPPGSLAGHGWKEAVCHKWLHPVSASSHSAFTRWVIYGEAAAGSGSSIGGSGSSSSNATPVSTSPSHGRVWRATGPPLQSPADNGSYVQIDVPLDGKGLVPIPAADLVSPVFSMWLTLLLMYAANCLADYSAAATLNAAYTADMRRDLAGRQRSIRRHQRRRSADYAHDMRAATSWTADASAPTHSDGNGSVVGGGMRDALSSLAARGSFDTLLRTMSSVGHILGSPGPLGSTVRRASSMLFRDDFGVGLATGWLGQQAGTRRHSDGDAADPTTLGMDATANVPIPPDAAQPSFLPMFPWYSGTSADLLKTLFDLLISVRVFLGRFDMRTLQAATAPRPSGVDAPAVGGDGFTFEHLAQREEVWWDFVADTGDGGDPTYAIARCLAAPQVRVTVPPELVAAGTAGCSIDSRAAASLAAGQRVLQRSSLVVHGGDLYYPSPSEETFEQRLAGPYQDAFPPPGHVHPGHLVVNKPDLGPEHWAAAGMAECRCGGNSSHTCIRHCGGSHAAHPCRMCAKEAALRSYDGPTLFAVPGNHDWLDGLDSFQSHIQHRGWLGGWLLPQEKSYFAIALPHGWWVFGLDLALEDDIDMCQYSYFARLAEERLGPEDQVVLVQHCPNWLVDWFWGKHHGNNLRQLVRGPLRGRARMHLAGDLHFMMRHSFRQYGSGQSPSLAPSEMPTPAGASPLGGSPLGGSPTASRLSSRSATPAPGLHRHLSPSQLHQSLVNRLGSDNGMAGAAGINVCSSSAVGVNGLSPAGASSMRGGEMAPQLTPLKHVASCGVDVGGASPKSSSSSLGPSTEHPWALPRHGGSPPGEHHPQPQQVPLSSMLASLPDHPAGTTSSAAPLTIASKLAAKQQALPLRSPARSVNCVPRGAAEDEGLPPLAPLPTGRPAGGERAPLSLGGSPPSGSATPFNSWWPGLRVRTASSDAAEAGEAATASYTHQRSTADAAFGAGSGYAPHPHPDPFASVSSLAAGAHPGPGWHLNDPEHLVVCGTGGAFCHPTHVFSESRFRPEYHPAAGPIYIKSPTQQHTQQQSVSAGGSSGVHQSGGGGLLRSFPSGSSLYSLGHRSSQVEQRRHPGGEYRCERAFPTPQQSQRLGRANLTFRSVNNRFDIVGGLLYYLLVISVLPRCTGVAEVLEAHTVREAGAAFVRAGLSAVGTILSESYLSLATLVAVFGILLGLCRSGGIGALPGVPPMLRRRPEFHGSPLAVRARLGGVMTQLTYAAAHCLAHLVSAISLLLLLELAIEVMIKYEGVGRDGYHSLYKWYRSFETQHFPDPMGMRDLLARYSLGTYPTALKWVMAVFDVPEAIAVSRTAMCSGGGLAAVTRVQAAGYYLGVLAYYWLLATPTVAFVFGAYLYISVNWFHVHYDEAFSSLQVPHFKGFLRFHITRSGDLEMFGLALDKVPHSWREDPRWCTPHGGGNRDAPAHRAKFPSRWVPVEEKAHLLRAPRMVSPPEAQLRVVDYLLVPRYRQR